MTQETDTDQATPASERERSIEIGLETMAGDLRNAVLTYIRALGNPWAKMPETEQADVIDAIDRLSRDFVRRGTALIARNGFDAVPIVLADFTVKGRIVKGKFEATYGETSVIPLGDHQGKAALIVLADPDAFYGESSAALADPDEPQIPFGDGDAADTAEAA